ncbi:MAG: polysaccharide deacetylase family protein [Ferruginibacter sp.]
MDPEPRAILKPYAFLTTILFVLVFSANYFYKNKPTVQQTVPTLQKTFVVSGTVVSEKKEHPPSRKKKKTIYLSFDDGPNKGTEQVINIVNEQQIPVTLFIIGEHVYASRLQAGIYDSILKSNWIEIANHSYSHALGNKFRKFYTMPDSVVKDFKRCADSLQLKSNIVRTPGRNIWRTSTVTCTDIKLSTEAADSLRGAGFDVVGWDLEWHFTSDLKAVQSSEELSNQVDSMFTLSKTKTPDHLVLLAHDQVFANSKDAASLKAFIETIKQKNDYDFAMIKDYPGLGKKLLGDSVVLTNNSLLLIK